MDTCARQSVQLPRSGESSGRACAWLSARLRWVCGLVVRRRARVRCTPWAPPMRGGRCIACGARVRMRCGQCVVVSTYRIPIRTTLHVHAHVHVRTAVRSGASGIRNKIRYYLVLKGNHKKDLMRSHAMQKGLDWPHCEAKDCQQATCTSSTSHNTAMLKAKGESREQHF